MMDDVLPIIVVGCLRDIIPLKILILSIERFLIDATTIYIINSELEPTEFENKVIGIIPSNSHHSYTIKRASEIVDTTSTRGWVHQQILKLFSHKLFDTDYMVMDCSNIIIKPTKFNDFKKNGKYVSSPINRNNDHVFQQAIDYYQQHFNVQCADIEECITPFIFQKHVVSKLLEYFGDEYEFVKWFNTPFDPSEFFLYSIFMNTLFAPNVEFIKNKYCAWHWKGATKTEIGRSIKNPNVRVITVHKSVMADEEIKIHLHQHLNNIGIEI